MDREYSQILTEIKLLKQEINLLKNSLSLNDIEEISLSRASEILHLSNKTVERMIKSGSLKAREHTNSKGKLTYRIKLSDLRNINEKPNNSPIITGKEYIKNFFTEAK